MKRILAGILASFMIFIVLANSASANSCEIPFLYENVKTTGNFKYKVIFLKYLDSPTYLKGSPKTYFNKQDFKEAETYFSKASENRARIKFEPVMQWFTMPKNFSEYSALGFDPNWQTKEESFLLDAYSLVDPVVDFSDSDGTIFISDRSRGRSVLAYAKFIAVDGKKLGTVAFNEGGGYQLTHEILHNLGLRDLYRHGGFTSNNNANHPVKHYSIMGKYYNGTNPLAYEKFLLGWLSQKSVKCQVAGMQSYNLSPLDKKGGTKLIVVPISASEVLTVEYRRSQGVDKYIDIEGVLVSHINSDIPSGQLPIRLLNKSKPLKKGKVVFNNISVEVNGSRVTIRS